jgi:hypothetical protein
MSKTMKNKEMNSDVYKLRSRVIGFIYEAKKLVPDLPRITVRITTNHDTTLACAQVGKNIIWVSERAVKDSDFDLRTIVFHEIVHTAFKFKGHDEKCPLMRSIHKPLSKKQCEKLLIKYKELA